MLKSTQRNHLHLKTAVKKIRYVVLSLPFFSTSLDVVLGWLWTFGVVHKYPDYNVHHGPNSNHN